jgi:phosphatidylinositol glycan class O
MILPLGWYLPKIISLVLKESKSNSGPAPFFLFGLQIVLALSAGYWILEFGEHWSGLNPDRIPLIKILKVWVARAALGLTIGAGGVVWSGMPLCIEIKREEQVEALNGQNKNAEDGPQVTVYGFANAFGSAYLLFVMLGFSLLFLVSLPTGQVVLVLGLLVLFCHLQVVDAMRDSKTMTEAFSQEARNLRLSSERRSCCLFLHTYCSSQRDIKRVSIPFNGNQLSSGYTR